jgi:3-oxoacyl-[acyl-carrier-protein] synthase-3
VRALFGDGAAATLVESRTEAPPGNLPWIGPFVFGTDGRGKANLIVPAGGMRRSATRPESRRTAEAANGNGTSPEHLFMNGPEIFTFTLRAVPKAVHELLVRAGRTIDDVDLFVFHQANQYMLEHLRAKLKVPLDRFVFALRHCGNTVSSTIPIALKEAAAGGLLPAGRLVLLVGFGVGYSWGATLIRSALEELGVSNSCAASAQ